MPPPNTPLVRLVLLSAEPAVSRTIPRLLLLPLPLLSGNTKLPLVAVLVAVKDVVIMPPPAVALLVVVVVVVISTLAVEAEVTTMPLLAFARSPVAVVVMVELATIIIFAKLSAIRDSDKSDSRSTGD